MQEKNNEQYISWILDLKQKIQQSQIKAAIQVNSALIEMYWDLGKEISERNFENTHGSDFFSQLSKDLRTEFPETKGLSESNLKYYKRFHLFYNQIIENRQQLVDELENNPLLQNIFLIPWGHHVTLMTKCKTHKKTHFYTKKKIKIYT